VAVTGEILVQNAQILQSNLILSRADLRGVKIHLGLMHFKLTFVLFAWLAMLQVYI